jgi:ribosomal protein S18 acetylase RimI-like enzyme
MEAEIVAATPDRVPELAELLGQAFADDPIITWPFPVAGDVARTTRLFEILDGEFSRSDMLWEVPRARGVAMWVPPDGFERYLDAELATRDPVTALTEDDGKRYQAFWDWIESNLPDESQWFLDHVAVARSERGRGVGSALVRFGLERAAGDDVTTTLETARPENIPIYEHLGFETYLEADAPDGGPHLWFMRADPV